MDTFTDETSQFHVFVLNAFACGSAKWFHLGSLVYDSCGLYSIRVGLCVSPPLSGFNTLVSTSSLELKAALPLLKGNHFSSSLSGWSWTLP